MSRYWLDDMVVVQVCCRFRRTILVVKAGAAAPSAGFIPLIALIAAPAVRKSRRFMISFSAKSDFGSEPKDNAAQGSEDSRSLAPPLPYGRGSVGDFAVRLRQKLCRK